MGSELDTAAGALNNIVQAGRRDWIRLSIWIVSSMNSFSVNFSGNANRRLHEGGRTGYGVFWSGNWSWRILGWCLDEGSVVH